MYIHSDFAEEQQEDRRKKDWVMPVLTAGTLLAGGLAARSLLKDAIKAPPGLANSELAKKSADESKKVIKDQINKNYKSGVASVGKDIERLKRRRRLLAEVTTKQRDNTFDVLDVINDKNKKNQYSVNPLPGSKRNGSNLTASRVLENRKLVEQARELAKSRGLEYSMRYTTTANFAMAGTMSGLKSGVLSKITGDLGQTVQKAKNWLQKAGQAKQEVVGTSKRIIPPSPYAPQLNKVVKPSSYDEAVRLAKEAQQRLNKNFRVKDEAALRTNLTAGSARQINRGAVDRYSKSGSQATINDNRSLRLKYTRDPVTGALVSAAYKSPISFLCDL